MTHPTDHDTIMGNANYLYIPFLPLRFMEPQKSAPDFLFVSSWAHLYHFCFTQGTIQSTDLDRKKRKREVKFAHELESQTRE